MSRGWGRSFGMTEMLDTRVNGKTLGIIGFGRIRRAVAKRAQGFGMRVIYTDMHRAAPSLANGATFYATVHEMLPHCQVLKLHVPGGSVPLMKKTECGLLPAGAILSTRRVAACWTKMRFMTPLIRVICSAQVWPCIATSPMSTSALLNSTTCSSRPIWPAPRSRPATRWAWRRWTMLPPC